MTLTGRRVRCDLALYHGGVKHTVALPWTRNDPKGSTRLTWEGVQSGTELYFDPMDKELIMR